MMGGCIFPMPVHQMRIWVQISQAEELWWFTNTPINKVSYTVLSRQVEGSTFLSTEAGKEEGQLLYPPHVLGVKG